MSRRQFSTPRTMSLATAPAVTLPLVANGRRVVVLLVLLALVAALSFLAGSLVRAPQQTALDAVGDTLTVTHPVEERVVSTGVELPGRVVPGTTIALDLAANSGATRLIVTRSTLVAGGVVQPGSLLGEVSGNPLIALPPGVPLYRDMVDGSTGADVAALQSALQALGLDITPTGEVGSRTLAAVAELYARAGAENPDEATIRWTELLPVIPGATVVTVASVGTVLSAETPLATVQVSPDVIVVRATVLEADELSAGQVVALRTAGVTAESAVVSVGDFTTTEEGSGRDVTVAIPAGITIVESEPVTVSTGADAAPGPAIPTLALRQDAEGAYVQLKGKDSLERVSVSVIAQSAGWTAIKPDERLPVGTPVLVSP